MRMTLSRSLRDARCVRRSTGARRTRDGATTDPRAAGVPEFLPHPILLRIVIAPTHA